jgi:transcriptional regulator with XRE-family HTH domain
MDAGNPKMTTTDPHTPTDQLRRQLHLGRYLRKLRKQANKSLRQVQREAGISASYLASIENGDRKIPRQRFLERLAECYGRSPQKVLRVAGYATKEKVVNQQNHRTAASANPGALFPAEDEETLSWGLSGEGMDAIRAGNERLLWVVNQIASIALELQTVALQHQPQFQQIQTLVLKLQRLAIYSQSTAAQLQQSWYEETDEYLVLEAVINL